MDKQNIPILRFPEFQGEWSKSNLDELSTDIMYGMNAASTTYDGENKYIRITDIDEKSGSFSPNPLTSPEGVLEEKFKLREGDLLFARTGASVGKSYLYNEKDGILYFAGFLIKFSIKKAEPLFIYAQTLRQDYNKWVKIMSMRSGQPGINAEEYKSLTFLIPSLPEQQKIASFLTEVDNKLQGIKRKKELLEQYKKGIMQKLFSQQLRFKDENGNPYPDWEKKKLGEVAERVKRKNKEANENVLTISAQHGLISQLEFFNKSVSAKDVTGYYLLKQGEFAYNKSYSNGYPMGAIKRLNRYEKGVVSTLYICFKFNQSINSDFIDHYFDSGMQNHEISKVAQEGARNHGLLNIGVNDFFDIKISFPSIHEQTKIANFLTAIDQKIEQVSQQIAKAETWKKGLLQKMFV